MVISHNSFRIAIFLRHRNLGFIQWSLAVSLGIFGGSELVGATPVTTVQLAQQQESTSQDPNRAAAERASAQAQQLLEQARQLQNQGTAESRQQALAKYEEALSIWQQLAVNEAPPYMAHGFETTTLLSIGTIYRTLNEPQKA